jgi:hypothetical protein
MFLQCWYLREALKNPNKIQEFLEIYTITLRTIGMMVDMVALLFISFHLLFEPFVVRKPIMVQKIKNKKEQLGSLTQ